jgi:hypothetical protein
MSGYTLRSLHVWLLVRRLKAAGEEGKWVTQVMYDQFQRDTELRVHGIGIQVGWCSWCRGGGGGGGLGLVGAGGGAGGARGAGVLSA